MKVSTAYITLLRAVYPLFVQVGATTVSELGRFQRDPVFHDPGPKYTVSVSFTADTAHSGHLKSLMETIADDLPKHNTETVWKCGDPYQYSLPVLHGIDPWLEVLHSLRKKDELRCQRWREDLQSSLLNASIFAAVVTAFLVDTYKNLRDDPVEMLLIQVLSQMSNTTDGPQVVAKSARSTKATIILNHALALSLVAHVFIILMAVISLQWLREHLQTPLPDARLNPRICFSMYQMCIESADRSYLPTVPSIIAVLQQHAIICFLIGLGALLFEANWGVGVTWIVGSAVVFLLMSGTVIHSFLKIFQVTRAMLFIDRVEPQLVLAATRAPWEIYQDAPPAPSPYVFTFTAKHDPMRTLHDLAWLLDRDQHCMSQNKNFKRTFDDYSKVPDPLYDALQGLMEMKKVSISRQREFTMVDYCVETILTANDGLPGYPYLIHRVSRTTPLSFGIPSGVTVDDPVVMLDDATLHLFSRNTSFDSLPLAAERRSLEICIRLTEWMYCRDAPLPYEVPGDEASDRLQHLPTEWVAHILENRELEPELTGTIRGQVCLLVLQFFKRTKTLDAMTSTDSTMDTSTYLGAFLESCAKIMTHDGDWKELSVCDGVLSILLPPGDTDTGVYALQAAVAFCIALISQPRDDIPLPQALARLIAALCQYEQETGGLRQGAAPHITFDWDQFLRQSRKLGVNVGDGESSHAHDIQAGGEDGGHKAMAGSSPFGQYGDLGNGGEGEDGATISLLRFHDDDAPDSPRHVVLDVAIS